MASHETGSGRVQVAGELTRESFRRPWAAQLGAYVMTVLVMVPAVWICDWALPGFHTGPPGGPLLFAAVLALVGLVLQPVLVGAAVRLGWLGVLLLAFLGQALVVMIAARLLPMVTLDDYWTALVVAIVVGLVGTVLGWIGSAGTSQVLVGRLVSTHRRRPVEVDDPDVDGVLFVQMDGVPFPVLQMAVSAGTVPTLTRWIRSGSHTMTEWTPKLPATTPASQMGILHGVIDGIPAFRWYDRARDKVMVANKPADAAVIEADLSTGRGLLVDDGVSISNLFTGDAPAAVLTMSRRVARRGARPTGGRQLRDEPVRVDQGAVPLGVRADPGPVPGQAGDPARRATTVRAHLGDRAAEGGHQRRAARPQHHPGGPAHAARHPVDLRRLRRLRRDRPPRRRAAPREPGGARGGRRRAPPARARGGGGAAALPLRDPLRPRPVPGRHLRRPLRRGPGGAGGAPGGQRGGRVRRQRRGLGPDAGPRRRAGLRGQRERTRDDQRLTGDGQERPQPARAGEPPGTPPPGPPTGAPPAPRPSTSSAPATWGSSTCGARRHAWTAPSSTAASPASSTAWRRTPAWASSS